MKLEIKGGRVVDPAQGIDRVASLYVAAGKVAAIGKAPGGWHASRVIDAKGLVVAPGLIDLSARLREPGFEYKATLESEMDAAIAGGVTSLACPPDTDPPLDEPGLVEMLKHRARLLNQAHVYPIGALTVQLKGTTLTEMGELSRSRVRGVLARGHAALRHAGAAARDAVCVHVRLSRLVASQRSAPGQDRRRARRRGGDAARPAGHSRGVAETIALMTIVALVRDTGVRVHLCRLSTAEGVAIVRAAKKEGLPVTCDVAIHHLHLCDVDIGWFDSNAHMVPPLRTTRDRAALRAGVADGTIDLICSDHAPVDDDGKQVPFGEAEPGATGLELLLPLTLKWAAEEKVALPAALARITSEPAKLLDVEAGDLRAGSAADICIFDPGQFWTVERKALKSQGKNTPFLGLEVPGKVRYTLVGGQVVYEA